MIKVMYLRESKQQWTAVARLQRAGSSEHRSWLWGGSSTILVSLWLERGVEHASQGAWRNIRDDLKQLQPTA